jgi:hypothetical protein
MCWPLEEHDFAISGNKSHRNFDASLPARRARLFPGNYRPYEAFGLRTLDKESSLILFFNDLTFLEYGDSRMAPHDLQLRELAIQL